MLTISSWNGQRFGGLFFFFPFIHTQKDYLRRLVILKEVLGLQLDMFRRYFYLR